MIFLTLASKGWMSPRSLPFHTPREIAGHSAWIFGLSSFWGYAFHQFTTCRIKLNSFPFS